MVRQAVPPLNGFIPHQPKLINYLNNISIITEVQTHFFSINVQCPQCFTKKVITKTKKNGLRFSIVDLRAPWDAYFMSLDIENFLSVSRVQNSGRGRRIGLLSILLKKILLFLIPKFVYRTATTPVTAENCCQMVLQN